MDKETGAVVESCTIVTVPANDQMQVIHDRMPAVLRKNNYDSWLNPQLDNGEMLHFILELNHEEIEMLYVSNYMGKSRNDGENVYRYLIIRGQQGLKLKGRG